MALEASSLAAKSCTPCGGGIPPLSAEDVATHQRQMPEWSVQEEARRIERTFKFKNFAEAFAFVQQAADLARPRAITRTSASAGATRRSRYKRRRSRACTRTISSWRRSWIVWWEDEPASLTVKNQPVSYAAS